MLIKKIIVCFGILLILIVFIGSVYAITGSLGGGRMILTAEKGEEIERNILVKNVNNEGLNITLFVTGELADNLEIEGGKEFNLPAGEEKKVYFTIYSDKEGVFETKINVQYTPKSGNGVGLSSTVILKVGDVVDNENDADADNDNISNNNGSNGNGASDGKKFNILHLLLISPIVLLIALIFLLVFVKKRKLNRKRSGKK